MLNLFRTNQLLFSGLLLFYAAVLHIAAFVVPNDWQPTSYGYFSGLLYNWIGYKGIAADTVAIFLILIQATAINAIIASHRMDDVVTLFPGLFYTLIASALPEFLHLSPLHLANTFYIIAIWEAFKIYKNPAAAANIFNIGFWVSVGSLFYFSYGIFILLGLIILNILRAFTVQERLMVFIGALVPYILASVYVFFVDKWGEFVQIQFVKNIAFLDFRGKFMLETYLKIAFVDIFLVAVIFSYGLYGFKKNIQVQKKFNALYWGLFFAAFTLLFQAGIQLDHLLIIAVPLSLMISVNFTNLSPRWAEILHLFILITIFVFQYRQYLLPG